MKRIGKSIISWMCMLIMTIGMIVPVMAEVNPSVDAGTLEENYPTVTAISYGGTYSNTVPV
ncbi:MAG: hypothetical protein SPM04_00335, partial [Lachnospira sp.]|nr:hypothetical protein [Lachnospira sp.]